MTRPDLDALEKLADDQILVLMLERMISDWDVRDVKALAERLHPFAESKWKLLPMDGSYQFLELTDAGRERAIKALIAELKEGREAVEELLYAHTDKSIAMGKAFLARNGGGQ